MASSIESANVVGFKTASVAKANYKAFSLNLADVNNPTAGVKIDKLFTIDKITTVAAWGGGMDQIWRWDTTVNKWAKYGYQKKAFGGTAAWRKYDASTGTFTELTDDDKVLPGETFLYYRGNDTAATLTLAGQVKEFSATASYTIAKANYQFVAYPWPIEIKISDLNTLADFSSIGTVAAWGGGMDQIWRWDTTVNKWAKYGYQKKAFGGTAAWRKYDASTGTFAELTDNDKIAADEGFLYYRGNDSTLKLTFKARQ